MAKALELNPDTLTTPPPVPRAAQVAVPTTVLKRGIATPKAKPVPLQVRWPADKVKAAKLAAIQGDFPTVSEFMLACFDAYMKTAKKA